MALYINGNKASGGTNIVHLTQAQYDALPSSKNYDGKVYMITDVNGDGSQFQPVIYSEEEREIGVWIDGKPLYEKTLNFDISENSEIFLNLSTLNIDRIISINLNGKYVNNLYQIGNDYYYNSSDYLSAYFVNNNSYLAIRRGSEHAIIDDGYITIQYTKSTDQAGSGTWTPQGVPAVHYSTDEQVVGTWIDGKTLYEKTINSNLTLTNSWQNYFDLTGVNKIIDVNKIIVERDGEQISYAFSNNALTSWVIRDGYIKFAVQGDLLSETWILKSITIQYTKTQGGA